MSELLEDLQVKLRSLWNISKDDLECSWAHAVHFMQQALTGVDVNTLTLLQYEAVWRMVRDGSEKVQSDEDVSRVIDELEKAGLQPWNGLSDEEDERLYGDVLDDPKPDTADAEDRRAADWQDDDNPKAETTDGVCREKLPKPCVSLWWR